MEKQTKYRIVERFGFKNKKVFVCESNAFGFWSDIKIYKNNPSWFDTWCGNHYSYAIFNTYDEAELFIKNEKSKEQNIYYI